MAPMRAIVVDAYGDSGVLQVKEIAEPDPGPGEVAIDVAFAGVNYAEVMARRVTCRRSCRRSSRGSRCPAVYAGWAKGSTTSRSGNRCAL